MRCSSAIPARYVHLKALAHRAPAAPLALVAGLGRDAALAPAGLAGLLAHQLAERRASDRADPPRPVARRAGLDRRAGLGAVPVAVLAHVDQLVRHLDRLAGGRLGERDLHLHGEVASLDAARTAAPEGAAERIAAEERVEDVGEGAEAMRLRAEPARVEPLEAVAVVGRAALGVGEDLVGLGRLLELLLRLGVVPVHVGVQLAREAPERLLDLLLVGLASDAEHLVRISPHSSYTSATKRDSSVAAWRTAMIAPG